jgi:hypothetical protein
MPGLWQAGAADPVGYPGCGAQPSRAQEVLTMTDLDHVVLSVRVPWYSQAFIWLGWKCERIAMALMRIGR